MHSIARKLIAVWLVVMTLAVISPALGLTGAVWTTTVDGRKVDANIYDQKCPPSPDYTTPPPLVPYLSGGPSFASPTRWVPDGDYYFQVTDPSGKVKLSTDGIADRLFTVWSDPDGVKHITYLGPHHTGADYLSGNVTIALCPFLDTPNPGNEYKLWITRVGDWDSTHADSWGPANSYGFIPRFCKTDNFKVRGLASVWGEKTDKAGNPLECLHVILYSVQRQKGDTVLVRINDTCTNAAGEFSFSELAPGKYAVDEDLNLSQPPIPPGCIDYSGYVRVSPPGPIFFTISKGTKDGPGAPIYIGRFVNKPGGPPPQAALAGLKFLDKNGDGLWDSATEPTLAGWVIRLEEKVDNGTWQQAHDANGNLVPPQTTGADGTFNFGNLPVNMTFRICETPKTGWKQTAPNTGGTEVVLWPAVSTYITVTPLDAPVTVVAVNGCYIVNFGQTAQTITQVGGLRFGNKLAKLCVKKRQAGTGTLLAGWRFKLYQADGTTPARDAFGNLAPTIVTGADGRACWQNLLAGDYVVKEVLRCGWRPDPPACRVQAVTVPAGGSVLLTFTNRTICMGLTPGYWKNWRNHYTADQFNLLLPGTIAANITQADAIFDHWDANPDDYLTILRAFLLADQLTINLTQHPELPNPDHGSLVPECVLMVNGQPVTLGDALASALAILANPSAYSREQVLVVKDQLAAFAEAQCP